MKSDSKSFGKRGLAIARPPSVIDQHAGSHSLCLSVCWCTYGCGRHRETEERFCPQAGRVLGVIKRLAIKSDYYCGRKH